MDFADIQGVVYLELGDQLLALSIYQAADDANDTSSPQLNVIAASSHTDDSSEYAVTQLLDVEVVPNLAIGNQGTILELVMNLGHDHHQEACRGCWDDGVHHDWVRGLVILRNIQYYACIHEQRSDEDQQGTHEEHAHILGHEGALAVLFVHFKNQQNLTVVEVVELREVFFEASNTFQPQVLLSKAFFIERWLARLIID